MESMLIKLKKLYYKLYYSFKYPESRCYSENRKLDVLLVYLKEIGIKSVINEYYYFTMIFNDDTKLKFWNANRWGCWMFSGELSLMNGKMLKWDKSQPSYEVLCQYKDYVISIEPKNKKDKKEKPDNDYSEYLPLKVLRKLKLKKLK